MKCRHPAKPTVNSLNQTSNMKITLLHK